MALKVAILEDDSTLLNGVLVPGLVSLGFDVESFLLAREFYRGMLTQAFDALVLDVDLPDEDGRQIARYLREHHPHIVIIALTGLRSSHAHSARPLVDAWLTKPVDIELLAVVLADLDRRKLAAAAGEMPSNTWHLSRQDWKLHAPDGRVAALTLRERLIVERLLAARSKMVSRENLLALLGDNGYVVDSRGLDILIHRLRRKVNRTLGVPLPLHAARGKGFTLLASPRVPSTDPK